MERGHQCQKEKKKRKNLLIIFICVVSAILLTVLTVFVIVPAVRPASSDWFDPYAQTGTLPGKSDEEIQAALNKIVEEGMFNISIASVIVFENGAAHGQARIENIEANLYHMSVVITLDDTEKKVYESRGIQPGQYIENIQLSEALPAGEYKATALFTAHSKDDYTSVGQAAAKITIIVEN